MASARSATSTLRDLLGCHARCNIHCCPIHRLCRWPRGASLLHDGRDGVWDRPGAAWNDGRRHHRLCLGLGDIGYVYDHPVGDARPIYRYYSGGAADHFYTASAAEGGAALNIGYEWEQIAFYVEPSPHSIRVFGSPLVLTKPIHRLYKFGKADGGGTDYWGWAKRSFRTEGTGVANVPKEK